MKFRMDRLAAGVTVLIMSCFAARGADASLDVEYYSSYVWRGQVLNSESVLQPAFSASADFGLSLSAWGNMDLTDKADCRGEFTEVDLTVEYELPLTGLFGASVGLIEYLFPKEGDCTDEPPEGHPDIPDRTDSDTREVFIAMGLDVMLSPTLTLYYDVDEVNGFYGNFELGHEIALTEQLALGLSASIGMGGRDYNDYYFGKKSIALNDLNLSAGLAYAFTEDLSASAAIRYTTLLDGSIRDGGSEIYDNEDRIYGNISAAYSF